MPAVSKLLARHAADLPPGQLTWIGLRPGRRQPLVEVETVTALAGLGLEGDHRCAKTPGSGRQVTLISAEYMQQVAHFLKRGPIPPALLRRNLVVREVNLSLLRHQQFTIGEAVFEGTMPCDPCSRMEEALGKGGFAAMMGHGGLCAKIVRGGQLRLGDAVSVLPADEQLTMPFAEP